MEENSGVATEIACDEKVLPHMLMPVLAEPPGNVRIREQIPNLIGRAFRRVAKHARLLVNHLCGDSPTAEATTGFFFQSPSATVSPKPSRRLFCTIMVEARCGALVSSTLHGGKSRM